MKILLATDGSDTAKATVDYLLAFPLPKTAEFTVVTVLHEVLSSKQIDELSDEHREAYDRAQAEAEQDAKKLLDEEVGRIRQAGMQATGRIRTGHPAEEIVGVATELRSDIVAVGSHGHSAAHRFLLGSTSDRVFEYAPCSVLIVKHPAATAGVDATALPEQDGKWRLLLAFDDSPPARRAIELCQSLPLDGRAELKIVTIMPLIHMYRQDIRQQLDWIWREKKSAAESALKWAGAEIHSRSVDVQTKLIEGTQVPQDILDIAASDGTDLIVIGHKGRKALQRFLLGSVTARIAHHAPCSVLSVRTCDEPTP